MQLIKSTRILKKNKNKYQEYDITNVSVNHNLDNPDTGVFHTSTGTVIPKLIEISVEFSVMHETHLGWDSEDNFSDPLFPYGADTTGARTKDDIRTARGADQAAIVREAEGIFQELEDERFLQAQQDIAKAMFLNPDGKTLNSFGVTFITGIALKSECSVAYL